MSPPTRNTSTTATLKRYKQRRRDHQKLAYLCALLMHAVSTQIYLFTVRELRSSHSSSSTASGAEYLCFISSQACCFRYTVLARCRKHHNKNYESSEIMVNRKRTEGLLCIRVAVIYYRLLPEILLFWQNLAGYSICCRYHS